ncbi:MAG TPA: hypothetical protein VH815_01150, partial [Acidobacteriota bacterium]
MKILVVLCMLFSSWLLAEDATKVLLDQEVEVIRADFKEFHFLVPETAGNYRFSGRFKTKGGMNDDISFLVLTQANYVRWFSKYDFQAAVKKEKATEGSFNVEAKAGETYYFVLDNFFSSFSNKKV